MTNLKPCPFCKELIEESLTVCPICCEELPVEENQKPPETIACPFCGEEILNVAKKCKHCGAWLNNNEQGINPSHDNKNYSNEKISIIGIIFGILTIILIIIGICYFIFENKNKKEITKMKKAIANYENIAAVYMVENDTYNLHDMQGYNCENIGEYFLIASKDNNCNFETKDGVYWQFREDGTAIISERKKNPKYKISMGSCYDGTVNCPELYPEVEEFLKKQVR